MKFFFILGLLVLLMGALEGCAGRVPSPKSAQSMTHHYFNRYGARYKSSIFHVSKISKVEVNRVQEQSLHLAEIESFVTLKDGTLARVLLTVKNNPPFGWSVISWEMLDLR